MTPVTFSHILNIAYGKTPFCNNANMSCIYMFPNHWYVNKGNAVNLYSHLNLAVLICHRHKDTGLFVMYD